MHTVINHLVIILQCKEVLTLKVSVRLFLLRATVRRDSASYRLTFHRTVEPPRSNSLKHPYRPEQEVQEGGLAHGPPDPERGQGQEGLLDT